MVGSLRFNRRTGLSQESLHGVSIFDSKLISADIATMSPVWVFSSLIQDFFWAAVLDENCWTAVCVGNHQPGSHRLNRKVRRQETASAPTVENAKQRGFDCINHCSIGPRRNLIWAGATRHDFMLRVDGGKPGRTLLPPKVSDWTRLLIEASHFDPAVAYAAVDRSKLDDRRHTCIEPAIMVRPGASHRWYLLRLFCGSSRGSSEQRLLFAGTELGVYVSFDDGDHWQSLQLNLPVARCVISRFTTIPRDSDAWTFFLDPR